MRRFREIFKTALSLFKDTLNDKGKFSLIKSLVLILCLSMWTLVLQIIAQGFNLFQLYSPITVFNVIPIILTMSLLYFVIGKISVSFIITNVAISILLLINHYKIKFRNEPLLTTDFSLGKEAGNILSSYKIIPDITVIFIIVFCILSFWFVIRKIKNKRPGLLLSLTGISIVIFLAFVSNSVIYKNIGMYNRLLSRIGLYQDSAIVSAKGLVYSLLNDMNQTKYTKPTGYSEETVSTIYANYAKSLDPQKESLEHISQTPDVIAVMIEAYTDIQDWGNVTFTDKNPYRYFNYLKTKGCCGEIFVPGFGGATAYTEFEFLTGNNTSAISSSMPMAYKTIINKNTYSIARTFKELGYRTTAIHPGHSWFYNRQNAYPRLGFDKFISIEDLPADTPKVNHYVTDSVAAELIIDDHKQYLMENSHEGYFNFTVTIQNHGQYANDVLMFETEYISRESAGLTDEEYYIINNYLGGIKAADEFMEAIYEYINSLDRPTVLIMFGDHLPYLDEGELIYEKLGLDIKSDSYMAFEKRYSTDYVIVGNSAYLKKNIPAIKGHQKTVISSNYLAIKLFQYMNMELPPFFAVSEELMQYAPIISNKHIGTSAGFDEILPEEFQSKFDEFKILQYFNLKEYRVRTENQNSTEQ